MGDHGADLNDSIARLVGFSSSLGDGVDRIRFVDFHSSTMVAGCVEVDLVIFDGGGTRLGLVPVKVPRAKRP